MRLLAFITIIMLAAGCANNHQLPAYKKYGHQHKVIAVVPPESKYTGRVPDKMTTAEVEKLESAESLAFQKDIYDEIIRGSGTGKKDIKIDLQALNKTNQLLESNGISVRDSWKKSPEELCKLLGVDAVVRGYIHKDRFMSDFASYGISVAEDILDILRDKIPTGDIPLPTDGMNLSRTYRVKASAQVLEGTSGLVLWGMDRQYDAEWDQPVDEVVKGMSRQFAKRFPYRD